MVIGTTGHDGQALGELRKIAERLPIVMAPNMSLGVNLLFKLAELAARALDTSYDAEIVEAHHRHKVDAPSGTALGLGRAVAQGRGTSLDSGGRVCAAGCHGSPAGRRDRLQRRSRWRHRRRPPRDLRGTGRADRARAPCAGPLGLRPRRTRRGSLGRRAAAGTLLDAGRARALASRPAARLLVGAIAEVGSEVGERPACPRDAVNTSMWAPGAASMPRTARGQAGRSPTPDPPSADAFGCRPLRDASRRLRVSVRVSPRCVGAAISRRGNAQPTDGLWRVREVARRAVRGMDAAPGAHREVFTASRRATSRTRRRPEQATHQQPRQRQRGEHQRRGANRDRIARPNALA